MIEDEEIEKNLRDLDNICDECKEEDESVSQNLILMGFKICKSCRDFKNYFSNLNMINWQHIHSTHDKRN